MSSKNVNCLFCGSNAIIFTKVEHIIPESLGNKIFTLKNVVCDKCNSYFSKLEDYFIHHHYSSTFRLFTLAETKKGKPPKQKLQYGEAQREKNGKIVFSQRGFQANSKEQFRITFYADSYEFNASYPLHQMDTKKISRVLAKYALEILYYKNGNMAFSSEFDSLRQYARYGKSVSFIPYLWSYQKEKELDILVTEIQSNSEGKLFYATIFVPGSVYFFPCHRFTEMKVFDKVAELLRLNKVLIPEIIKRDPITFSTTANSNNRSGVTS